MVSTRYAVKLLWHALGKGGDSYRHVHCISYLLVQSRQRQSIGRRARQESGVP